MKNIRSLIESKKITLGLCNCDIKLKSHNHHVIITLQIEIIIFKFLI